MVTFIYLGLLNDPAAHWSQWKDIQPHNGYIPPNAFGFLTFQPDMIERNKIHHLKWEKKITNIIFMRINSVSPNSRKRFDTNFKQNRPVWNIRSGLFINMISTKQAEKNLWNVRDFKNSLLKKCLALKYLFSSCQHVKNRSKFECRPIRKQYIWINFFREYMTWKKALWKRTILYLVKNVFVFLSI